MNDEQFSARRFSGDIPWKVLAIEAVLVVLSVLLALGLNSWREGRANRTLAQRAVQAILDEAQQNCRTVQSVLPYHIAVSETKQEYEGLGRVFLRNDAWPLAQSAGAANYVDYEVASAIGTVHALQHDHRRLVEAGIQALYQAATAQDPELERFAIEGGGSWLRGPHPLMLADLIRIQTQLIEEYGALFAVSEDRYGIAAELACGAPEANR